MSMMKFPSNNAWEVKIPSLAKLDLASRGGIQMAAGGGLSIWPVLMPVTYEISLMQ
jgi:hypothetical protein